MWTPVIAKPSAGSSAIKQRRCPDLAVNPRRGQVSTPLGNYPHPFTPWDMCQPVWASVPFVLCCFYPINIERNPQCNVVYVHGKRTIKRNRHIEVSDALKRTSFCQRWSEGTRYVLRGDKKTLLHVTEQRGTIMLHYFSILTLQMAYSLTNRGEGTNKQEL